jgi:hypothetical protein
MPTLLGGHFVTQVQQCCAQVKPYPNATTTRQCQRIARLVAFVPDDNGNAVRNDVRGSILPFCGLHDPARLARRKDKGEAPVTTAYRETTFRGETVRVTLDRAIILARMFIKGAQDRSGILPYDCRDLLARWKAEDVAALAPAPRPSVEDLFG